MNAICDFRLCKLSDDELIDRIDKMTDGLYTDMDFRILDRHIPARPDEDYD